MTYAISCSHLTV